MNNVNSSYKAFIQENYPQYAVYEKVPAHGSAINNVILAPYKSEQEAQEAREKYGYNNDNYYIGKIYF
jgi:hypothetical protein